MEWKLWQRADTLNTSLRGHDHEARQGCTLQKRLLVPLKSHVIQSLRWCSHCDPNDALEKRAWSRRIGIREQVLNLRVFCISSQSHRFLFHSCTHDFPVAPTLTKTHRFNATRAIDPVVLFPRWNLLAHTRRTSLFCKCISIHYSIHQQIFAAHSVVRSHAIIASPHSAVP